MDKSLKIRGRIIKTINPFYTKKKFDFCNRIMNRFAVGRKLCGGVDYRQEFIRREDGSLLRICIYSPEKQKENAIGLLWLHGGGYAIGVPEQDIPFIKSFVKNFNCVVVAPDYTRSVEKPFPAALLDCYEALWWLRLNAAKLGVDEEKLFVGGDSAGGGLTAALTLYARDMNEVKIAFQMPLYPMIDDRETPSSENNNMPVWDTESNRLAWKLYLGDKSENVSCYAAPARATDFSELPPTLTYVGTLEPFRDETVKYVENLKNAGTDVFFEIFDDCYHGFDIVAPDSEPAKKAREFLMSGFSYAAEHYSAAQICDGKQRKRSIIYDEIEAEKR